MQDHLIYTPPDAQNKPTVRAVPRYDLAATINHDAAVLAEYATLPAGRVYAMIYNPMDGEEA